MSDTCAVVLAAGLSSRMGSDKLTKLLAGKPVISYAVNHVREAGISRVIVVVRPEASRIKKILGVDKVEYVTQGQPLGTGHAVRVALPALRNEETVVVLFGDCPFIDKKVILNVMDHHVRVGADVTIATSRLANPWSLGIVRRDSDGRVAEIAPGSANYPWMSNVNEIFAGLSVWKSTALERLLPSLERKDKRPTRDEYDLPDAIGICHSEGGVVETWPVSEEQALGLNELEQFYTAESYIRQRKVEDLDQSGVTIADGHRVLLDFEVEVGSGTVIRGPVNLHGSTTVGRNCIIGPDTTLINCRVEDECVIGTGSWENLTFRAGERAADRFRQKNRYFAREHYLIPTVSSFVFVLMPFKEPYVSMYESVIEPVVEEQGLTCRPGSSRVGPGVVTDQVWEDINRAGLIIAEISEPNTNVWYELGLAHALNKPTIMLTKEAKPLSQSGNFMVQHHRLLHYDPEKGNLAPQLRSWLYDFVSGTTS